MHRIFLLSPANTGGVRGRLIMSGSAHFDLAVRLRQEGAPLADVFSFVSGLYFRGKMAYAQAFASPPPGVPGSLVITAGRGLLPPGTPVTLDQLREIAAVPIDEDEPRYCEPLERQARALAETVGPQCEIVLLGSIATAKYLKPLQALGGRLLFPAEF